MGYSADSSVTTTGQQDSLDVLDRTDVEPPAGVCLRSVSHWFIRDREAKTVVHDVSIDVPANQFVALVGASGCGKTTILNMIAGLVRPEAGSVAVTIDGRQLSLPSPDIGYMWARDALFPWRSLQRNVEFGLQMRGVSRAERGATARRMIELVGLAGNERSFPRQLSHGMRQRGNLARLLAIEPRLFLMDEPFSALDAQTKHNLQAEFTRIWEAHPRTVVYVTHDLTEAALLADRVLVMSKGRVVRDLEVPFDRPRDIDELRFDEKFQEFTKGLWHLLGELESPEPAL